jgi:cupin superfamily acireductone dioxygenase involved in methionine salvage
MQEGDLVHIPQGVELWCETKKGMRLRMTEKPMAGVYLSTRSQYIYRIYANGDWNVKRRDVYPMRENNAIS